MSLDDDDVDDLQYQALMEAGGSLLDDIFVRPAWQARAACRGRNDITWFPERGASLDAARAVCTTCPVRNECLEHAMASPAEKYGVWGGKSERERRQVRAQQERSTTARRGA